MEAYNMKLDTHIEKVRLLVNKLFDINAMNWKREKIESMTIEKKV
jgi:hypothetical protein